MLDLEPCVQPVWACDCGLCDIERRALVAAKCAELQARFLAEETAEWNRLKMQALNTPMGRVLAFTTQRAKKVTA